MQFNHTWQWLLEPSPHTGEVKTQTRRIMKPSEVALYHPAESYIMAVLPSGDHSALGDCLATYDIIHRMAKG